MAKSRVEKNKELYDNLELEPFELEDIGSEKEAKKKEEKETKKQELVPVKKEKKNQLVKVEEKAEKAEKVEEEFVVEQPISYTNKLSVEEILRAKLEKQQKLKDEKKGYKKSPVTDSYTAEMMQKTINQSDGVDIRKEANIKVKRSNNTVIAILVLLLIAIIVGGAVLIFVIL